MLPPSHLDADTHAPCACCGVHSDTLTRHGACPDCDGVVACRYCGAVDTIDADGHCPACADVPADALDWLCAIYDHAAATALPWHLTWDEAAA